MLAMRYAPCVLLAGLFTLAGCSRGPQLAEVEGTVKINGKPADRIMVEFWPEKDGPRSIGETDRQGRYKLMADDGKRQGALVGRHKVVLRDVGVLGDKFLGRAGETVDMTKGQKPRVAPQYTDPHKTPVRKEVTGGKKNVIDLEIP